MVSKYDIHAAAYTVAVLVPCDSVAQYCTSHHTLDGYTEIFIACQNWNTVIDVPKL